MKGLGATILEGASVAALASAGRGAVAPRLVRPAEVLPAGQICTARLVIRPWRTTDLAAFVRVVRTGRERLRQTAGFIRDGEGEQTLFARMLDLCRKGDASGGAWRRLAFLDDGRLVGGFNVLRITRGLSFDGECTWWVAPDMEGQGLATEGVQAMVDHALDDLPRGLGLHTLTSFIRPENAASVRVAQKCGMERRDAAPVWLDIAGTQRAHDTWKARVSNPTRA